MRLVTLAEYATLARPSIGWLLHKLIPRPGITLLLGPPKVGKSFLALQLGLAIAQGREFLGQAPAQPSRVLYVQLDTSESAWRDRLKDALEAGYDLGGPLLMVHPEDQPLVDILTPNGRAWCAAVLHAAAPDLVILDVLREVHNRDENDNTAMKQVGDAIVQTFGAYALLLIHHTRKIPQDVHDPDPVIWGRGASYLTGKADAIWLLHGSRLKIVSRFDEPAVFTCARASAGFWSFPEAKDLIQKSAQLLTLCAEFPERPHSALANLARERWGISRATYYRLLGNQLCAHRSVSRTPPI